MQKPRHSPYAIDGDLPLTVRPADDTPAARDLGALCGWLESNREWVQEALVAHGALRFRGFDVSTPVHFERLARAVAHELQNEYLGTSPRDAVTEYVFNASELPDFYPVPQHCEMSFCAEPPRRVFFCCLEEPAEGGGETPLCDFRKVWRDLDPDVRKRFEGAGIRIVRNYAAPGTEDTGDPTQLKPWPQMFLTTDKRVVEARCRDEGFEATWIAGDALRIVSSQPVSRAHPVTGEPVWHNHTTTFHRSTAASELRRVAKFRPTGRHQGLVRIAEQLEERLRELPSDELGMHSSALDGSEFPDADLEHVRDVVWRHMVIEPWRLGDVIAVDNHSTSHGRIPYEGPRRIVVCWA